MARVIKFRQPVFVKDQFKYWHYWGYINNDFVGGLLTQPESQQFTGLRDVHDKEIYEGDIDELGRVVVFKNGAWMFEHHESTNHSDHIHPDRARFIKIIGNIHENPELLKPN